MAFNVPNSRNRLNQFFSRIERPFKKIAIWGVFNVAIGMLPFGFVLIDNSMGNPAKPNFTPFLVRGELLIIVVALTADAVGEVVLSWQKVSFWPRLIIIAASLVLIVWSSYAFARISTGNQSFFSEVSVVSLSWQLFLSSLSVALFTKFIVEL